MNQAGPIPPKLLDRCPASEIHIAFPLLRNLHSDVVLRKTAGRFTLGLPCAPVDYRPDSWKTALVLLDWVPNMEPVFLGRDWPMPSQGEAQLGGTRIGLRRGEVRKVGQAE